MDRGSTREDGAGRENTGRGSLTPGVTQGGHQRLPPRLHVDGTLPLAGRSDGEREEQRRRRLAEVRAIWPLPEGP